MNRMLGPLAMWWSDRTVRERRMVGVMLAILAAVVVWLGIVRPLMAWRAAAAERAAVASTTLTDTRRALASLGRVQSARRLPAEGVEPLIRRTAEAAGLEVVTVMSASGQMGFELSSVDSARLFNWLAVLEREHGLVICSLGVTENADATLNVEGGLAPGGCQA